MTTTSAITPSRQVRRAQERAASKASRPALHNQTRFVPVEIPAREVAERLADTLGSHPGRYPKHGIDNDLDPDKGQIHGGVCNRTACDHEGATWWNRETFGFYCKQDAFEINRGHENPLCVPLKAKPTIEEMETLRAMRIAS